MYDVIVVGAGPSGSSTAYELSKRGVSVLVLERAKLPRYKACGGYIPLNFFQTLPESVRKTLEKIVWKVKYFGPRNATFIPENDARIAAVMRDRFDFAFLLSAGEEGAQWVDGVIVTDLEERESDVVVRTSKGDFQAKFVVGADGATGIVKKKTGLGYHASPLPALEVEIPNNGHVREGDLALIHFTIIRDGYAWVFPKNGNDSVGIASFGRDRKVLRRKLEEWAEICGYDLRGRLVHGHPIPVWRGRGNYSTRRVLLVGDAADTVDPMGGEGIRYGIISGRIATTFLMDAIRTGGISPDYSKVIQKEIHEDFRYASWLGRFFYSFPGFCFNVWVRTKVGTKLVGKVLYGELRYRDLFFAAFRTLFRPKLYARFFQNE